MREQFRTELAEGRATYWRLLESSRVLAHSANENTLTLAAHVTLNTSSTAERTTRPRRCLTLHTPLLRKKNGPTNHRRSRVHATDDETLHPALQCAL